MGSACSVDVTRSSSRCDIEALLMGSTWSPASCEFANYTPIYLDVNQGSGGRESFVEDTARQLRRTNARLRSSRAPNPLSSTNDSRPPGISGSPEAHGGVDYLKTPGLWK